MPRTLTLRNFGTSGLFNGTDNYIDVGTLGSLGSNMNSGFSASFWIKPQLTTFMMVLGTRVSTTNNYLKILVNSQSGGSNANFIQIQYTTPNSQSTNGYISIAGANGTINDGGWHHVVMTLLPSTNTITGYVDGVQQTVTYNTQQVSTGFSNFTTNMFIGALNNNGVVATPYYKGLIDEMTLWNQVLTSTDATNLYNTSSTISSPVAYFKFDEGTGSTTSDSSGNANNGTWQGTLGSQWSSNVQRGRSGIRTAAGVRSFGTSGNFNGTDNYVNIGTNISTFKMGAGSFTIAGWINGPIVSGANNDSIFAITAVTTTERYGLQVIKNSGLVNTLLIDSLSHNGTLSSSISVLDSKWHHLAMTVDRTTNIQNIYIDGVLNNSNSISTVTGTISPQGITYIGRPAGGSGTSTTGMIDDVRVYNAALSSVQVYQLYDPGTDPLPGNLIGYWDFHEGAGSKVSDSSGNANTGTWIGTLGSQWTNTSPQGNRRTPVT